MGTYNGEGIKAIADAMGISGSLTQVLHVSVVVRSLMLIAIILRSQVDLSNNYFDAVATSALHQACKRNSGANVKLQI